jgi:hypothetical protein
MLLLLAPHIARTPSIHKLFGQYALQQTTCRRRTRSADLDGSLIVGLVIGGTPERVNMSRPASLWTVPWLDLFIDRAGDSKPHRRTTALGFELQFCTNHQGTSRSLGGCSVALSRCSGSQVVAISSRSHRMGSRRLDDLQSQHGCGAWRGTASPSWPM